MARGARKHPVNCSPKGFSSAVAILSVAVSLPLAFGTGAAVAGVPVFPTHNCGTLTQSTGGRYSVNYRITVFAGHLPCRFATRVIKTFWTKDRAAGNRTVEHGGPGNATTYWTLKGRPGWICGLGAGAGLCHKGKRTAGYEVRSVETPRSATGLGARPGRSCGHVGSSVGGGYEQIRAHGLTCSAARRVIRASLFRGELHGWQFIRGTDHDEYRKGKKRITGVPLGDRASASRNPPIARACGAIRVHGRRLRVDITEVLNRRPGGCGAARTVMRRFLRTNPVYDGPNGGPIRFRGRTYGCYASRPDGNGWDYHCSNFEDERLIDYGAGRRF